MDPVVKQTVESTVELLVRREYETVARLTEQRRLTADELREAVEGYGRTLVSLPEDWPSDAVVVQTHDGAVAITVDFWTVEEGRSDRPWSCG
jgi:hypothetical protein